LGLVSLPSYRGLIFCRWPYECDTETKDWGWENQKLPS